MRNFLFAVILCFMGTSLCLAQKTSGAYSNTLNISVKSVKKPPVLELVHGSIQFYDANKNNAIDANEQCGVRFKIQNTGYGDAVKCFVRVVAAGSTSGISVSNRNLPLIKIGETQNVDIPISSGILTEDGTLHLTIEVVEPSGFGVEPFDLRVSTKKFNAPLVRVVDHRVTSVRGDNLKKGIPFDLQILVQNTQYGVAENVRVSINIPLNVTAIDGEQEMVLGTMQPGEKKLLSLSLIVTNYYEADTIPVQVKLSEKYGKYAENEYFTLQLNQSLSRIKIEVEAEQDKPLAAIQTGSLTADVDKNIPLSVSRNDNTFVVIISNENYRNSLSAVNYAVNDGSVFKQYCVKTLGIPENQIRYISDATLNEMRKELDWVKKISVSKSGSAKIIFYYAGHGVPDEATKDAYLLPVDGYGNNAQTALSLNEVYSTLGNADAEQVIVLLDACFSGTQRGDGMLVAARGVRIASKAGTPQGNMVVLSAATGDQTAYPYMEMQHGMFTYFLLKKLQETNGNVQLGALFDYIKQNVYNKSLLENSKEQTPTVSSSINLMNTWHKLSFM